MTDKHENELEHHSEAAQMIRQMVPGMVDEGVRRANAYADAKVEGLQNTFRYEVTYLRTVGSGLILRVQSSLPPALSRVGEYARVHVRDDVTIQGRVADVRHFITRDPNATVMCQIWVMIDESQAVDDADQMPGDQHAE